MAVVMNPVEFLGSTGLVLRGEVGGSDGWPSVLLLHGGGQTHHSWSALAHQLVTAGYRVISYDARGHGDSDWALDGDYTLDALAADLNCVVRKIGRPVAVVGASVGGLSGFWQTAHHPESVAALVLVDIALRPAPEGTERILEFMRSHRDGFESLAAAAKAVADFNPHRKTTGSGSNLMRNLRRAENGQLQWHWDPALLSTGEEHYRNERFERLAAVSDRITAPTLLVRGQRSDIVGTREVEQMRELIPHLEVREVEGAGHMVVGDSNDTFAHCIIAFLRHHYPRGAGSNR